MKRSQGDIIRHMRWASGLENHPDLVAYWKFNDPDSDGGQFKGHMVRLMSWSIVKTLLVSLQLTPGG